jgi:hypothetical protein
MLSTPSRRSESSTVALMYSGRLSRPVRLLPPKENPNLVDDDLLADRSQGLTDKLFVRERAVHLGGVEEGDAEVDGGADEGDAVLLADGRTVRVAKPHAAKSDRGYL